MPSGTRLMADDAWSVGCGLAPDHETTAVLSVDTRGNSQRVVRAINADDMPRVRSAPVTPTLRR